MHLGLMSLPAGALSLSEWTVHVRFDMSLLVKNMGLRRVNWVVGVCPDTRWMLS